MNIFNVIQSKMVQNNNKWNISREKGEVIINRYMIEILQDSKDNMISLSSLLILLNLRTKHIKFINNSKKKPLSVYIRCIHGSPLNFLDNNPFYDVIKDDANIQVKLQDKYITSKNLNDYKDWILVDEEDDFILV
tara:strand:+ start:3176 stop:3580 length:405 start_codon:yes stop_codon:yes gene_type:complete